VIHLLSNETSVRFEEDARHEQNNQQCCFPHPYFSVYEYRFSLIAKLLNWTAPEFRFYPCSSVSPSPCLSLYLHPCNSSTLKFPLTFEKSKKKKIIRDNALSDLEAFRYMKKFVSPRCIWI
jgi:hypothetical protein